MLCAGFNETLSPSSQLMSRIDAVRAVAQVPCESPLFDSFYLFCFACCYSRTKFKKKILSYLSLRRVWLLNAGFLASDLENMSRWSQNCMMPEVKEGELLFPSFVSLEFIQLFRKLTTAAREDPINATTSHQM